MVRYLPAVMVAVVVIMAGCAGAFAGPTADAPETTADRPIPDGTAVSPGDPSMDGATGSSGTAGGVPIEARPSAEAMDAASRIAEVYPGVPYGSGSAVGAPGTIAVSGTGQVSADPDLALVFVTVQARADTADAARGQVATDVSRMREAIRALGIDDDDVRTTYYQVSPRYDYSRDRQELIGYVATHAFEIRSSVDEAGDVVDTAVGNGADQVSGVRFTLTEEAQRELRQEALTNAVENARADADAIATATGVTITGVHSASTSGPSAIPYAGRIAEASDGQTTFDTGPVTVTAYVNIAYTIE